MNLDDDRLTGQVAMWGQRSEVTTVKERQGTRVEHRKDVVGEIRKCCGYAAVTKGIVSLAVNLLPYFKPDKAVASATFPTVKSKVKEYFGLVKANRALKAMAWYVRKVDFKAKEVAEEELERMSQAFVDSDEFQLEADEGMTAIVSAIRDYKLTSGEIKVNGKTMAEGFERLLMCGFAREASLDFEVCDRRTD